MSCGRYKATASLLVPLLLIGVTAAATTPPRGRVVGPAPTTQAGLGRGGNSLQKQLAQANTPACTVYFDATGQLNFIPPAANTPLVPGITSANIIAGGPSYAHGTSTAPALAGGPTLTADAAINALSLQQPYASIAQNQVQGIAYFATSTTCTSSSFSTVLQSNPAGTTAPGGTVLAQLTAGTTITASYTVSYSTDGITYLCTGVNGRNNSIDCSVWQVNVAFSFLSNSFLASGAGTYTLTIDQVVLSSP